MPYDKKAAAAADYQKNKVKYDAASVEWNRKNPEGRRRINERWEAANPERFRRAKKKTQLWTKYKLHIDDYETMAETQNYVCAICRKKCKVHQNLTVDHNSETGEVHALLCNLCNRAIGMLQHDGDLIEAASTYVKNFYTRPSAEEMRKHGN